MPAKVNFSTHGPGNVRRAVARSTTYNILMVLNVRENKGTFNPMFPEGDWVARILYSANTRAEVGADSFLFANLHHQDLVVLLMACVHKINFVLSEPIVFSKIIVYYHAEET